MFKRISKVLLGTLTVAAFGVAFAGGPDMVSSDQFGVGIDTNWQLGSVSPFLTYVTPTWSGKFGFDVVHGDNVYGTGLSGTEYGFSGQLGLRMALTHNVYFTYGVAGFYIGLSASGTNNTNDVWGVGPYVGLDYHATQHFLVTATTQPFTYVSDNTNSSLYRFFDSGTVGMAYLF